MQSHQRQGMGAVMTTAGAITALGFGATGVADVLLGAMILAAAFAICLGCDVFAGLIHLGVIAADVCAECADIWSPPRPQRG